MKRLLILLLLGYVNLAEAHQPEVSTTMLIEQADGEWLLQINAALTAFQYEMHDAQNATYASPEEFKTVIIEHLLDNILICFNQTDTARLQNAQIELGHETNITFTLTQVPETFESIVVRNSSFKHIHQNESTLVILKKGFYKDQFILNDANTHQVELQVDDTRLVQVRAANTSSVASMNISAVVIIILILSTLIYLGVQLSKQRHNRLQPQLIIGGLFCFIALGSCFSSAQKVNTAEHTAEQVLGQDGYFGSYAVIDEQHGTNTVVTVSGKERKMVTNALPNHATGAFPNPGNPNRISAQRRTYTFPLEPVFTGEAKWAREPGVALNGVKFEPQTAEVVACESGENYRVEAIQNLIDLGLDFNNAHVQPTGAYHYHGTPKSLVDAFDAGEDLVHIGFALDGFPIYYSKSGKYKPSFHIIDDTYRGTDCNYANPMESRDIQLKGEALNGTFVSDWEYVAGSGDLDECNGVQVNGSYAYLVTDEYPYIGRCLKGEFKEEGRRGRPPRGRRPGGNRPGGRHGF